MKQILLFTCVLAVLLLTCSKKSTSPPDDNPPIDTTFRVSYSADEARAVQQHISAQSGGSVIATDKDGAQIQLDIPAHALASDADITIIPFSSLQISGPGGAGCGGCDRTDSLCCFKGALFEPSGLVLDSPATLTITFPPGTELPFQERPVIVFLDSASDRYEVEYTQIDTLSRSLTTQIVHFSGYATDDGKVEELEAEIYQIADSLTKYIGTNRFYSFLYPMTSLHDHCRLPIVVMGDTIVYPDLAAAIENIMFSAYDKHAKAIQSQAFEQPPCDGLFNLRVCIRNLSDFVDPREGVGGGWSNHDAFSTIEANTEGDFDALFRKTALEGKRLCDNDSCAAGRDLLFCALGELGRDGSIHIDSVLLPFKDTVGNWALTCCKQEIILETDKDVINNLALFPEDDNTIAKLKATVSLESGPWDDAEVRFQATHKGTAMIVDLPVGNNQCHQTTDSNGVATCALEYLPPTWGGSPLPPGAWQVCASIEQQYEDTTIWIRSNVVEIELRPVVFTMEYNYTFSHATSGACGGTSISGSATGMDEDTVGFGSDCYNRNKLVRTYSYAYSCSTPDGWYERRTETLLEPINIAPCFWGPMWKEITNSRGETVEVLDYVAVNYWSPAYITREVHAENNSTDTTFVVDDRMMGNGIWPDFGTLGAVRFSCLNGTFAPIMYDSVASYTEGPVTGSASTHLRIAVGVSK